MQKEYYLFSSERVDVILGFDLSDWGVGVRVYDLSGGVYGYVQVGPFRLGVSFDLPF